MKVIAAYLRADLGGNATPSGGDLKAILSSVGAEADNDTIELLLTQVEGKDITELIASGREKLAFVPAGGGAVPVSSSASSGAAVPAATEAKKEEKAEEKEESDDKTYNYDAEARITTKLPLNRGLRIPNWCKEFGPSSQFSCTGRRWSYVTR